MRGGGAGGALMLVNITPRFQMWGCGGEERDGLGNQHEVNSVEADKKGGSSLALSSEGGGGEK